MAMEDLACMMIKIILKTLQEYKEFFSKIFFVSILFIDIGKTGSIFSRLTISKALSLQF